MLSLRFLSFPGLALLAAAALSAPAAAQQTDHLACIKVKDPNPVAGPVPVTISELISDSVSDCVIKKVRMTSLCVRVAKDGGDDPHAGQAAAEAYGCYKVKCGTGKADGSLGTDDQFGVRTVVRKGLLTLCTPVELPPVIP